MTANTEVELHLDFRRSDTIKDPLRPLAARSRLLDIETAFSFRPFVGAPAAAVMLMAEKKHEDIILYREHANVMTRHSKRTEASSSR